MTALTQLKTHIAIYRILYCILASCAYVLWCECTNQINCMDLFCDRIFFYVYTILYDLLYEFCKIACIIWIRLQIVKSFVAPIENCVLKKKWGTKRYTYLCTSLPMLMQTNNHTWLDPTNNTQIHRDTERKSTTASKHRLTASFFFLSLFIQISILIENRYLIKYRCVVCARVKEKKERKR